MAKHVTSKDIEMKYFYEHPHEFPWTAAKIEPPGIGPLHVTIVRALAAVTDDAESRQFFKKGNMTLSELERFLEYRGDKVPASLFGTIKHACNLEHSADKSFIGFIKGNDQLKKHVIDNICNAVNIGKCQLPSVEMSKYTFFKEYENEEYDG